MRLAPRAAAARITRRLIYDTCDQAGFPVRMVDDAALVAGELVTASIRQARRDVDVVLHVDQGQIRIGVRDTSTAPPLLGLDSRPGPERSTAVVERLSSSWGYCRSEAGREVWALLRR